MKMETKYMVLCLFDPCEFDSLEEAEKYAKMVSMSGEPYIDEPVSIEKIERTIVKTFRNGSELGL